MTKNEVLRLRVLAMVADGALPPYHDGTFAAGDGDGLACAVCDKLITHGVQYELNDVARGLLRMHLACFLVWQGA